MAGANRTFPAMLVMAACAQAQAAAPVDQRMQGIEEVVVTATYRETNLMDTPQSISALTGAFIDEIGAQEIGDVFQLVPGLNMAGTTTGSNRFSIRGVSSQTGTVSYALSTSTIGIYLDGTPLTSALGPANQLAGNLFDVDRVEVLKGPQGTLFGEGSQGGTIRYLYNQPDPSAVDLSATLSLSDMADSSDLSHRIDAMLNVPIIQDRLALRVLGFQTETAGFIDNLTPDEPDFNTQTGEGVRAALRYDGDRFSITGSAYYAKQETEGGSATVRAYEAQYARFEGYAPYSWDESKIYNLTIDIDFDWATLTSITSYADREGDLVAETPRATALFLDNVYAQIFNLGNPGSQIQDGMNIAAFNRFTPTSVERIVQELRLVSPGDGRFRWTAGYFYKDSEDGMFNTQKAQYFPGRYETFGVLFDQLLQDPANSHTDTLTEHAAFGEVSFDLTDRWEVTAGVRVSNIEQDFENTDTGTDDTPVSPKLVITWRPTDDLMTYASYTTGFRPGNVNNQMEFAVRQFAVQRDLALEQGLTENAAVLQANIDRAAQYITYDGDTIHNYELGLKATFLQGRAQLTSAVYYLDWEDLIQAEQDLTLPGINTYNFNSGSAHARGLELELAYMLAEGLTVRLAGDLNDSELDDGPVEGNDLTYAPGHSASVAIDYDLPISDSLLFSLHLDHSWVDSQYVDVANTIEIPSYYKTNARVSLRQPGTDRWRVSLFGRNLGNEEIMRNLLDGAYFWEQPRTIGLEFAWNL